MRSPLPMRRKLPDGKGRISATAVRASTIPSVEEDTHHQDRANMWDKRQPSNNVLEEDQDIWDPRGRASDVEAGPIGRAGPTARAPAPTSRRTASSTRCGDAYLLEQVRSARPRRVFKFLKNENATCPTCTAVQWWRFLGIASEALLWVCGSGASLDR